MTSRDSEASQQSFQSNAWSWTRDTRNKELTRENETNFEPALNQSKQVQTEFLILTKPLKFDLNAVTKQTYFVRDLFPG